VLAEAISLSQLVMQSPTDLVIRCRQLTRLLGGLGVDRDRKDVATLRAIDSEADRWPIGVDPTRLDPLCHERCASELAAFEVRC
jgi:hypothetical protein